MVHSKQVWAVWEEPKRGCRLGVRKKEWEERGKAKCHARLVAAVSHVSPPQCVADSPQKA
eukprot:95678-Chlamydomonas_euryale.AAC.4